MTRTQRLVRAAVRSIVRPLCRVDAAELAKMPARGPLIVVANHINFLEIPALYPYMGDRPMAGFAKAETWRNPLLAFLGNLWGGIPLHRGEVDRDALRRAEEALAAGRILFVTPEGTRSGDGRLRPGKAGVTMLALHSGAPLLPMVHYGGEQFWDRLRRLRRTQIRVVVGQAFTLDAGGQPVTRAVRQQMADEIMYQMAALLPPDYRGAYADLSAATQEYLRFLPEFCKLRPQS